MLCPFFREEYHLKQILNRLKQQLIKYEQAVQEIFEWLKIFSKNCKPKNVKTINLGRFTNYFQNPMAILNELFIKQKVWKKYKNYALKFFRPVPKTSPMLTKTDYNPTLNFKC